MDIKSKAEFFRLAKAGSVTRTQVGGMTTDEWDEFVIEARKQLIEQGANAEDIVETDTKLEITGATQFWHKPTVPRILKGELVERSSDYYFAFTDPITNELRESFGNKKDLKLVDNKLILTMFNKAELHYTID